MTGYERGDLSNGTPAARPPRGQSADDDRRPRLEAGGDPGLEPRSVICAPLYNNVGNLPETLRSLASQTRTDFALVLLDDCSADDTCEVARSFAAADPRVWVFRNPVRVGMLYNTRRVHHLARSLFPAASFLAYASDHDLWHPEWLARTSEQLEADPRVVLSYPHCTTIAPDGRLVETRSRRFETHGERDGRARFRLVHRRVAAGDMVYGLYRAEALDRVGPYQRVLLPDRLLLSELALYGEFRQVRDYLWQRRLPRTLALRRQREVFFPGERVVSSYLPWWVAHGAVLARRYVVEGRSPPAPGRLVSAVLVVDYLAVPTGRRIKAVALRAGFAAWRRLPPEAQQKAVAARRVARRAGKVSRRTLKPPRRFVRRRIVRPLRRRVSGEDV